jgi:predicted nucleic acid-binding protein
MAESRVCLDASFIVALLLPERFSQAAFSLWQEWITSDVNIVAPTLLHYEVTSALYRKALQGLIAWEDHKAALEEFLSIDIEWQDFQGLTVRATELARRYQRPNTYDAFYLALAEKLGCQLWTADERFYNAVEKDCSSIHWVGSSPQSSE